MFIDLRYYCNKNYTIIYVANVLSSLVRGCLSIFCFVLGHLKAWMNFWLRYPETVRVTLRDTGINGRQADRTRLHFFGEITAKSRLCNQLFEEKFIINQIRQHVILGMPSLTEHGCVIRFESFTTEIQGHKIACTGWSGKPVQRSVQDC